MNIAPPILDYGTNHQVIPRSLFKTIALYGFLAALGAVLAVVLSIVFAPKPFYRSTALLRIASIPQGLPLAPGTRALSPSEVGGVGKDVEDSLNTSNFRQQVIRDFNISRLQTSLPTPQELSQNLSIAYIRDTKLFRIEATDPSPDRAAIIAGIAAESAVRFYSGKAPAVEIIATAQRPLSPANRYEVMHRLAGAIGGILLPVCFWLVRRYRRFAA